MPAPHVTLRGVTKVFAAAPGGSPVHALGPIDVTIDSNEFFAIVGPSGCGKSTLLELIAGLTDATEGVIEFEGRTIKQIPDGVGVVFQEDACFPWLNVRDNVALGQRLRGIDRQARCRAADEKLALVGLEQYGDRAVYELSGGMQQRVGIARALASDPAVLLMDEPMGALDAFTRESVQEILLRAWAATHKMVFFITHSVEEALFLATRLIVMSPSPGRISHVYDDVPFSRQFLDHGDTRRVKSEPAFIALREEVLSIIHHRETPPAAAGSKRSEAAHA